MRVKSENQEQNEEESVQNQNGSNLETANTEKPDLKSQLNDILKGIEKEGHQQRNQTENNLLATIKKEMNLFEGGGTKGLHLQLAYEYLKTIKPTSVESERAFSSAGYICNKVRARMSDSTLDDICFLRSYFRELDKPH